MNSLVTKEDVKYAASIKLNVAIEDILLKYGSYDPLQSEYVPETPFTIPLFYCTELVTVEVSTLDLIDLSHPSFVLHNGLFSYSDEFGNPLTAPLALLVLNNVKAASFERPLIYQLNSFVEGLELYNVPLLRLNGFFITVKHR